jgi:hypothetical protein
VTAAKFNQD